MAIIQIKKNHDSDLFLHSLQLFPISNNNNTSTAAPINGKRHNVSLIMVSIWLLINLRLIGGYKISIHTKHHPCISALLPIQHQGITFYLKPRSAKFILRKRFFRGHDD